jgi:Rha family phage regulatory protein
MEVSSRTVAEVFGKHHHRVLHAIRQLEIPEEINRNYFRSIEFTDSRSRAQDEIIMTRDGFSLLCMGFTGAKAMQWKLKFLAAFNAMEEKLVKESDKLEWNAARLQIKAVRKSFTNAVQDFVAYATEQGSKSATMYYANITKMEYKALDLLDKQKSAVGGNFRDTLDLMDISALTMAEVIAKSALESGMQQKMHYKEIYQFAKQKVNEYAAVVSMPRLKP